jgi:threonine synthase
MHVPLIERFRDILPVTDATPVVTLGEGSTPLIHAERLSQQLEIDVWLKWEGANPTGSFKDRGMTMAVSKALEERAEGIVCASTGNTAASAAAYAARAGLPATIVHPTGAVANSKLVQGRAAGARLLEVQGSFVEAFARAADIAEQDGYTNVNSTNPYRIEGQKTAAFELIDELGGAPDALLLPYGGGGNTTAYAKGFREAGRGLPRLHPVEVERRSDTFASAIRITDPVHDHEVEEALSLFGGEVVTISEDEIVHAWRLLAREEGLFCEPASAAGVAALLRGAARTGERVVCVITGHGLKDPDAVALLDATISVADPALARV